MTRILVIAGDAGGARALLPVIFRIYREQGIKLDCCSYAAATDIWEAAGVKTEEPVTLGAFRWDRLLTGTSYQPNQCELGAIRNARSNGVRSISLVDSWVNCRPRFTTSSDELILPDAIAVLDDFAITKMVEAGFPYAQLHATGLPSFDMLSNYIGSVPQNRSVARTRDFFGIGSNSSPLLLFASQPLSQMAIGSSWGFHEHEVLRQIVRATETILMKRKTCGSIILKRHPRENSSLLKVVNTTTQALTLLECDNENFDYRDLINAADLVIGMNSNLLLEACYLRRAVVSYQPNLSREDPLPSNHNGWSEAVTDPAQLHYVLERELFDREVIRERQKVLSRIPNPCGATEAVIELLMQ